MASITPQNFDGYFSNKTILRPYFFAVVFPSKQTSDGVDRSVVNAFEKYTETFLTDEDIDANTGLFELEPWLVKSVSIPDFSFKKDGVVMQFFPQLRILILSMHPTISFILVDSQSLMS